ncbi:hypothetical protein Ancab_020466 [Ancistrocladus abbreviatus]
MECNRDEATRAKEIAERKFEAKDIAGAKKFAMKAQALYPGLEGISQMLATLDVYISAENKINGAADWYAILGVTSQDDDDTVRKQYRKLALMLHPDKNKSVGAEGAFKFISEAWSLLSDKNKRAVYDQKRSPRGFQQKVTPPNEGPSAPSGANGFYNFAKTTTSAARVNKNTSRVNSSSTSSAAYKAKSNTFWTVCHRCKMQYEYLRVYLNHNLLCPNCREPFIAIETPPPIPNGSRSSAPWNSSKQRQSSNHQAANKPTTSDVRSGSFSNSDGRNTSNFQWTPFSRPAGASTVAQAASVVQQTYEKVKREREEAQAAKKREKAMKRKNQAPEKMGGVPSAEHHDILKKRRTIYDVGMGTMNQMGLGTREARISSSSVPRHGNTESIQINGFRKPNSMRELSQIELRKLLMEKAREEVCKRLSEWKSATVANNVVQKEKASVEVCDKDKGKGNTEVNDATCSHQRLMAKDGFHSDKSVGDASDSNLDRETFKPLSIDVPDPDFYDFDKDRTERSFGENQVWAAYDDDDGMPRYYAIIHSIVSQNPFKMLISWLNSKTNSELGPLDWVSCGFAKTCGDFRVGRHEIYDSLNAFSHKVKWTKGTRGVIRVFPRKGDVWALYRHWSPDWNELTANDVIHKYDMVEVLEDYDEELGVIVTPLVKVAGFKTVFHQHLDPRQVRRIPREEMFRFSHQVPSHLLTGQEAPSAPKGCRELDPAATPFELLHVIPDVKGEDLVQNEANGQEQAAEDAVRKPDDKDMLQSFGESQ